MLGNGRPAASPHEQPVAIASLAKVMTAYVVLERYPLGGEQDGSDSAAGGCLAFFTHVTVGGRSLTAVGVVMGQGQGSDTSVLLAAAGEAATQLVGSVAPTGDRGTHTQQLLLAPGRAPARP